VNPSRTTPGVSAPLLAGLVLALLGSMGWPAPAAPLSAQSRSPEGITSGSELYALTLEADRLDQAFDLEGSLALLNAGLLTWPREPALRWRAARTNIGLGYLAEASSGEEALAHYRTAEEHALAILAIDSTSIDGLYWQATARGRQAFHEGLSTQVRLIKETHLGAEAVLALDPDHAGAHHILGTLNVEVLRTPRTLLWMGANILRIDAMRLVSWEKAELHHDRAIALEPDVVIHRMRRGEFYMLRKRWDEAMEDFRIALELPETTAIDSLLKSEVRGFIARVEQEQGDGP
jgi:tetratricopeptide (TPR) repeat protein